MPGEFDTIFTSIMYNLRVQCGGDACMIVSCWWDVLLLSFFL